MIDVYHNNIWVEPTDNRRQEILTRAKRLDQHLDESYATLQVINDTIRCPYLEASSLVGVFSFDDSVILVYVTNTDDRIGFGFRRQDGQWLLKSSRVLAGSR